MSKIWLKKVFKTFKKFKTWNNRQPGSAITRGEAQNMITYLLNVDLDVLLKVVSVQVQHKIVDKVKPITHNYQRQLIG